RSSAPTSPVRAVLDGPPRRCSSRVGCGGGGRSPGRWSCPRAPRPDLLIPRSTSRRTSPSTSPSAGRRSRWVRFLVALGPADGCSQNVAIRATSCTSMVICTSTLVISASFVRVRYPQAAGANRSPSIGSDCRCVLGDCDHARARRTPRLRQGRSVGDAARDRSGFSLNRWVFGFCGRSRSGRVVGGPWDDLSMLDRGDLENFGKAEVWEAMRASRLRVQREQVDELLLANHLAGLYEAVTLTE